MSTSAPRYWYAPEGGGRAPLARALKNRRELLLLLDYDGTLVPIRPRPELALPDKNDVDILHRLTTHPGLHLALVTGRSCSTISSLLPVERLHLACDHGLRIRGPGKEWVHPRAHEALPELDKIHARLLRLAADHPTLILERKDFSLSIHYRQLPTGQCRQVGNVLRRALAACSQDLMILPGKKVWEIRPTIDWNKGSAALIIREWIGARPDDAVVYLGDDRTDEDAFRALRTLAAAFTIRIGFHRSSHARYYLKKQSEVREFLTDLDRSLGRNESP